MTYLVIAVTCLISILSFNNRELFGRLQFNAYQIVRQRQYYRLLTHGFVHANWSHLLVNMFVLYFFGRNVEAILASTYNGEALVKHSGLVYLLIYLAAIIFASSISLARHKDDAWYNSVGASGGVSAIMFFCIFFEPWEKLYLYGIIAIPGIIFGIVYLVYSQYMSRRGGDNVNHDAHFLGSVFGFVAPLFIDWSLINVFISELLSVLK